MRSFSGIFAVLVVALSAALLSDGEAQGQAAQGPALPGSLSEPNVLQSADCAPAPCIVPPIWPSDSVFTADAPIVSNLLNPKQLLLGSVDQNCPQDPGLGFYLSNNGGSTWQWQCMEALSYKGNEYEPNGTPMLGFDGKGTAYEAGQYQFSDDSSAASLIAFQKSADGGQTWSAPSPALGKRNSAPGYPSMAIDDSLTSPHLNTVYIAAVLIGPFANDSRNQVVVSHSNDGGKSWTQVPLTAVEPNNRREFQSTNLAVGKDGTVYLAWVVCDIFQSCPNNIHVLFSQSRDGGNAWSEPRSIVTVHAVGALPNTDNVQVENRPVIAIDNTDGPNARNLYIAMYSWTGTYMRVGVIRSTDDGSTWSAPAWAAPPSETHDQFFPWLSVSSTGLVGVSWMDRRNDPANTNYQAFAAISSDGGQSFGPNTQLTTGFSDPNRGGEGGIWIGDYTGNTWAGPNYFVASWMDNSETPYMEDVVGGIRLK